MLGLCLRRPSSAAITRAIASAVKIEVWSDNRVGAIVDAGVDSTARGTV